MLASSEQSEQKIVAREFEIRNRQGIHARPASLFVRIASRYDANVTVQKDDSKVSGKSIMSLLTLAASCGTRLKVTAEGEDADELMDELATLIENNFEEE